MMFLAEDVIKVDYDYYFTTKEVNAICKYNEKDGNIRVTWKNPNGNAWAYRRYGRILSHKKKLYFLPLWANEIAIYDMEKDQMDTVTLKEIKGCENDRFFAGEIIENKLVLVGCKYPAIVTLDVNTREINYFYEPYHNLIEKNRKMLDCFFRCDLACNGTKVYIASCISNQVLMFDVSDNSYEWYSVGNNSNTYSGIAFDGADFWLAPRRGKHALCWNPESNKEIEFEIPIEFEGENDNKKCTSLGAVYNGRYVIFPGMEFNKTIIIDPTEPDFERKMKVVDRSFEFYFHREGFDYALTKEGNLEIFNPLDYLTPIKVVTINTYKGLLLKLLDNLLGFLIEDDGDINLYNFVNMVKICE